MLLDRLERRAEGDAGRQVKQVQVMAIGALSVCKVEVRGSSFNSFNPNDPLIGKRAAGYWHGTIGCWTQKGALHYTLGMG
jgi:hypothetical protein|mmetsp:Transcript_46815/g.78578  ORF Transcript_46815/g.78578 Transcript_46815/m.78578 type:complete len:80 (+) Transcript_46815:271-510(+)